AAGGGEQLPHRGGLRVGDVQLETVLPGVSGAGDQQVPAVEGGDGEAVVLHPREVLVAQPLDAGALRRQRVPQDLLAGRALHGDQGGAVRGVVHLDVEACGAGAELGGVDLGVGGVGDHQEVVLGEPVGEDRKSTRLNSSHVSISYAVFCLKKQQ